jgi:hypothetical protein
MCAVFIHKREDKMWAALGLPPVSLATFTIGINNKTDLITVDVAIAEKLTFQLDQPGKYFWIIFVL